MAFGALRGSLTHNYSTNPGTGIATAVSTVANVAPGDLVVVVYGGAGAYTSLAFTCTGITCPISLMTGSLSAASGKCYVGYGRVAVGGTLSAVTASHSNSSADATIIASVFEGPFTNPPKDKDINHLSDSVSPFACPTTGTLAQAVELVIGAIASSPGQVLTTLTAGNGTMADKHGSTGANTSSAALSYQVTAATTAVIPSFSQSGTSTTTDCATLSFKNGSPQQDLTAGRVSTTSTIYQPTLTNVSPPKALTAGLISDADTFYAPAIGRGARDTTAGLVTDTDTFLAPVVGRGAVGATASLYTDADTFYPATVAAAEQALVSWASVYALVSDQALTGTRYSDPESFYAPVVGRSAWTLGAGRFSDPETFYAPTLGRGARDLGATVYNDPDTFYVPGVSGAGAAQDLIPGRYSDPDVFYAPASAQAEQALVSWVSTYSVGADDISPALFSDPESFYSPSVSGIPAQGLTAPRLTDPDTIYAPTAAQAEQALVSWVSVYYVPAGEITSTRYSDPDTFYAPAIGRGSVGLSGALYADPDTFYAPVVGSSVGVTASLWTDPDTFFAPEVAKVAVGEQALVAGLVINSNIFFAPAVGPVVVGVEERVPGARIAGGTFTRRRWRELQEAWAAQRALEMQAAELRAKSRRRIKLDRAAKIAEHALYVAQAHDEIDVKKLRLALQAATSAAQSFQAMREAERVIAISQKMVEDEDDEEAALMLILSGGG